MSGLTTISPVAQTRNTEAIPDAPWPPAITPKEQLSHHSALLPSRQPPAHLERCHSLLAGASPILPSHLNNLIYRKKKSSLTKLRAFCRRAEPLSGTTESLICVTYKINYRNPGTVAAAHRLPRKPGWAERAPGQADGGSGGRWSLTAWTMAERDPEQSGHALTLLPSSPQGTLNLSPAAPASLSSRHRALGNILIRWPHWLA